MSPREFRGQGASEGVFSGPIVRVGGDVPDARIGGSAAEEAEALETAIAIATEALLAIAAKTKGEAAGMLAYQIATLEDETLRVPAIESIYLGIAADKAWADALTSEIAGYESSSDESYRARASDLKDIRDRVLRALAGIDGHVVKPGCVVIADDLSPSLFLETDWSIGGAVALNKGSATSPVAKLARARGIPMVVGLGLVDRAAAGNGVVDGKEGILVLDPAPGRHDVSRMKPAVPVQVQDDESRYYLEPAKLKDGSPVQILINLAELGELDQADPQSCDGIGLIRSEFLFRGEAPLPDEESQYQAYRRFTAWAGGKPVIIRTLDVGGDRPIQGLTPEGEGNPMLGLRGIRLTLARRDLFRIQLRALARAAAHGDLRIVIPMVTVPAELADTSNLLDACIRELVDEQKPCRRPALGIMVETPAAAIAPGLFRGATFMSIDSENLTQYVTAAARDSSSVAALANPAHPAVLQLIAHVVRYGQDARTPITLCGGMAAEPVHLPALVKLGLRSFAVEPSQVARIKAALAEL